jgi:signal transduction histidine kinase
LSRWLSRPLSRLAAATEAVAAGNFKETVERSGVVELDRVVDQFNRMVHHLRESFRSLAAERDTAQRFAADAAHELKTPVATLRAYHEVLTERPGRLGQVSPAVGRQIERMEQVITGLLQIANLGEGSGIAQEPADLGTAVHGLTPVYEALAAESGLQLTITCPAEPVPCRIDRRLLELALNNLMDNACKYTEPGGEVVISLHVDGDDALITVQDSGPGIPPDELPYIFDRFHRGVATQCIPGTGLGLAIAREAVLRLGGQLTAESEPGRGSRFLIRLPLERGP